MDLTSRHRRPVEPAVTLAEDLPIIVPGGLNLAFHRNWYNYADVSLMFKTGVGANTTLTATFVALANFKDGDSSFQVLTPLWVEDIDLTTGISTPKQYQVVADITGLGAFTGVTLRAPFRSGGMGVLFTVDVATINNVYATLVRS